MINVGHTINIFADSEIDSTLIEKTELLAKETLWPKWATVIDSSQKARVCSFEFDGNKFLFKAFMNRDFLEPFKNIFSGPRALRAERGTRLLMYNGFQAPKVICMASGRKIKSGTSFILTEFIEADFDMASFFRDVKDRERRAAMARSLGTLIGKLHAKFIYHGDLRPGNILIKNEKDFFFIDNEKNIEKQSYSEELAIINLVQLNMLQLSIVSKVERMKFYKEYVKEVGLEKSEAKIIAKKVWQRTEDRMSGAKLGGLYS